MTATHHLLHAGYAHDDGVASSVSLVIDGEVKIVVDPGMVAERGLILDPLRSLGVEPEEVTHVVITHHHPDHTMNIGLFPNAEIVDFWARYRGDQWLDHEGDGYRVTKHCRLLLTPGHTPQDATLLVETDDGVVACTHAWWRSDRTPRSTRWPMTRQRWRPAGSESWTRPTSSCPGTGSRFTPRSLGLAEGQLAA
ncbi:MAG: MBL fold metallo-hydrolase [Chloroflexota bacterium]|nr:MBL fold metallo-hydrolase [Chloroflexota bacterium]